METTIDVSGMKTGVLTAVMENGGVTSIRPVLKMDLIAVALMTK